MEPTGLVKVGGFFPQSETDQLSFLTADTTKHFLLERLRKGKDAAIDGSHPVFFINLLAHLTLPTTVNWVSLSPFHRSGN